MRNTFATTLTKLVQRDKDIVLLSGDIGNKMFDSFKKVAPNNFYNFGIAEGSMMSLASGLGLSGLKPFVYTITPFLTTRCLEQIKIGACYHKTPITIIGTGSGLSYAELGATHHSFEDISILRSLPDIKILVPSDSKELEYFLKNLKYDNGPTYIRIGKKGEPDIYKNSLKNNTLSRIIEEGKNIIILSSGPIIYEAIKAAEILKKEGIHIGIMSLGVVKPLNYDLLNSISNDYKIWITLEEHSLIGGIGDAVINYLIETKKIKNIQIEKIGIPDKFIHSLGTQAWLRSQINLDAKGIVKKVKDLL